MYIYNSEGFVNFQGRGGEESTIKQIGRDFTYNNKNRNHRSVQRAVSVCRRGFRGGGEGGGGRAPPILGQISNFVM